MARVDAGMVTSAVELPGYRVVRKFWNCSRHRGALAQRYWEPRRSPANHCRRQHHDSHQPVREDVLGPLRAGNFFRAIPFAPGVAQRLARGQAV